MTPARADAEYGASCPKRSLPATSDYRRHRGFAVREIAVLHDGSPPYEYIERPVCVVTTALLASHIDSWLSA